MKKTYIIPEIVCVSITHQLPIATSAPGTTLNLTGETSTFDVKEESNVSDVNVWDDEW
ncbi:MAG: hypothetical protein K6G92_03415 [Bacteroidaceae bacterium]|nr:hypothetical protein [Bacteroidaceae bacterium]